MSETSFPINDLLHRRFQTSLIVTSITLCVASTLFVLLVGERIGLGISLTAEGKLTAGFSTVLSRFITFISILIFIVGAVIISFMVFLMMSQRVKDIGLMRAAGCPNDLIFGYFMTELLIVTVFGCSCGVIFGIVADFASTSLFTSLSFQIPQKSINFWLVLLVFVVYLVLPLIFGAKPILDTTKIEPAKAISPTHNLGLGKKPGFMVISKSNFTVTVALRNLYRCKSATIRIVLCLAAVFILVTVTVAGGIIADHTTKNWVEKAIGRNIVVIAHQDVCGQYMLLLSKFYQAREDLPINYTIERYLISEELLNQLGLISGIANIDERLVLKAHVKEIQGVVIDPETKVEMSVGDDREGESLIIGVRPETVTGDWFLEGNFLNSSRTGEAVIGDSLAQKMFSMPLNQSIRFFNGTFNVVGVCLDPVNNGNVTYLHLKSLQSMIGLSKINVAMVKIDASVNYTKALNQIRVAVGDFSAQLKVFELNEILDNSLGFIGYLWSTIMFLPLFSLISASLCLLGHVVLVITEQRQELGVLRALGARPRNIMNIVLIQTLVVLLSSYAAGIGLGIITTLLILISNPVITSLTVIEITWWLLSSLAAMFILSLYPAVRLAKKPILEIMV